MVYRSYSHRQRKWLCVIEPAITWGFLSVCAGIAGNGYNQCGIYPKNMNDKD